MKSTLDNIISSPALLTDIVNEIDKFSIMLNTHLNIFAKSSFKRIRKLNPQILLFFMSYVNGSSMSYRTALNYLKDEKIIDITEQSINEKMQIIDYSHFDKINEQLNNYIFSQKINVT